MSWDRKRGGRRYYCRNVRLDGEPRKVHVGSGAAGEAAEQADLQARLQREADKAAWEQTLHALEPPRHLARQLERAARLLTHTVLLAHGYYLHHRSEWRRRGTHHD